MSENVEDGRNVLTLFLQYDFIFWEICSLSVFLFSWMKGNVSSISVARYVFVSGLIVRPK